MDQIEEFGRRVLPADGAARVYDRVQRELLSEFGADLFRSYFEKLELAAEFNGALVFVAETFSARDWLRRHAQHRIEARLRAHMALDGGVEIYVESELPAPVREFVRERRSPEPAAVQAAPPPPGPPGFTFDTFCVDHSNHRAVTLLQLVASGVGMSFPLVFLHSPPGCGKTHLMRAAAHAALVANPARKVREMMAQEFIEEFQDVLRKKKDPAAFKDAVRGADLFMLDDVHRIAGKKTTEEEFLDTVAILNSRGRQVVITADQGPDGLAGFDDRLRHHLSGAAVCEIGEPDDVLRRRILEMKVRQYGQATPGFRVAPAALDMMARRIVGSGRLLDGAVSQLVVEARVSGMEEVTLESAEAALRDKLNDRAERPIKVATVLKVVARHNNMTVEQLLTRSRQRAYARPRQIAAFLCTQLTQASLPDIGRRFGNFDHSTILYSRDKIKQMMETDSKLRVEIDVLIRLIRKEPA
ncbi:MAG: DnaA/Hda family protein [Hyphomonadaceae bacterium]